NACPTSPAAKVAPFCSVPLLPPMISIALPSPGHQLTRPDGGGVQTGGGALTVTVNVHDLVLPAASVAVQVTSVVPKGNCAPDGGMQFVVVPGQLSATTGAG